jgi:hypothetical protein
VAAVRAAFLRQQSPQVCGGLLLPTHHILLLPFILLQGPSAVVHIAVLLSTAAILIVLLLSLATMW